PERGEITLVLRHNPLELAQWIIETPEGDQTLLALEDLQKGVSLKESMFNILLNIEKRKLR
ncbi:MAG: outer membrane lipoprotein carrier protein LolA, partial [Rhodobacteraceae bacterium]|nr:outer membrane lipoprotein carrier protein LolA [Paracoccaceae bacterium]